MVLGEKILEVRKKEGLSRREFSDLTGISQNTLKGYESLARAVSANELLKITNHSRFRKYALFLVTDDPTEAELEQVELLGAEQFDKLIDQLTEEQAQQVVEYMEFLLSKTS